MSLNFGVINGVTIVGDNSSTIGNGISSTSFSGNLTIPEFFNGERVSEIGQYAFYTCVNIKEVKILAKITSINTYAFYNCRSFEKINIPSSVSFIGFASFCMRTDDGLISPGSLTFSFEYNSELSIVGNYNFARKNTIIIYFCGYGPINFGSSCFSLVENYVIFSSTISKFNDKLVVDHVCFSSYFQVINSCYWNYNLIILSRLPILISIMASLIL